MSFPMVQVFLEDPGDSDGDEPGKIRNPAQQRG